MHASDAECVHVAACTFCCCGALPIHGCRTAACLDHCDDRIKARHAARQLSIRLLLLLLLVRCSYRRGQVLLQLCGVALLLVCLMLLLLGCRVLVLVVLVCCVTSPRVTGCWRIVSCLEGYMWQT